MPRITVARKGNESHGSLLSAAGQAPTKKIFSLTIPPVPKETHKAIATNITKSQPWLGQKAKLDLAQQRALNLRSQLKLMHKKLSDLEEQQEKAVEDAGDVREIELKEEIEEIEKSLNDECQQVLSGKEHQWEKEKRSMEREMADDLKRLGTDVEMASTETKMKRARLEDRSESSSLNIHVNETSDSDEKVKKKSDANDLGEARLSETRIGEDKNKLSATKSQELMVLKQKADDLKDTKKDFVKLLMMILKSERKKKEEAREK